MTQPKSADRYPSSFGEALNLAVQRGTFTIPTQNVDNLRAKFYGFLNALRAEGKAEMADAIEVITTRGDNPSITLRMRDTSPEALEVAAAIAAAKRGIK